jgi:hypothetical protein
MDGQLHARRGSWRGALYQYPVRMLASRRLDRTGAADEGKTTADVWKRRKTFSQVRGRFQVTLRRADAPADWMS